jgi:hypothetical protein
VNIYSHIFYIIGIAIAFYLGIKFALRFFKPEKSTKLQTPAPADESAIKPKICFLVELRDIDNNEIRFRITSLSSILSTVILEAIEAATESFYKNPRDKSVLEKRNYYAKYKKLLRVGKAEPVNYMLSHAVINHYCYLDFLFNFRADDESFFKLYRLNLINSPDSPKLYEIY